MSSAYVTVLIVDVHASSKSFICIIKKIAVTLHANYMLGIEGAEHGSVAVAGGHGNPTYELKNRLIVLLIRLWAHFRLCDIHEWNRRQLACRIRISRSRGLKLGFWIENWPGCFF